VLFFTYTTYDKFGIGLVLVLEEIKTALNLDTDQLELAVLINTIMAVQKITLFVFDYQEDNVQLEDLVKTSSALQLQFSDNFTETLKKYEISGVPNFDQ